jgi:hypothetical protein
MSKQKKGPTEQEVTALAARAQCSPKTARKALERGVDSIRGEVLKGRLRDALRAQFAAARELARLLLK